MKVQRAVITDRIYLAVITKTAKSNSKTFLKFSRISDKLETNWRVFRQETDFSNN